MFTLQTLKIDALRGIMSTKQVTKHVNFYWFSFIKITIFILDNTKPQGTTCVVTFGTKINFFLHASKIK